MKKTNEKTAVQKQYSLKEAQIKKEEKSIHDQGETTVFDEEEKDDQDEPISIRMFSFREKSDEARKEIEEELKVEEEKNEIQLPK